jgi:hypothetical protein
MRMVQRTALYSITSVPPQTTTFNMFSTAKTIAFPIPNQNEITEIIKQFYWHYFENYSSFNIIVKLTLHKYNLVLRSRSRWSGNILLEPEPSFTGSGSGLRSPKFFILNFDLFFVVISYKQPFDNHVCF